MNNLTSNSNLLPLANFKLLINSTEFAHTEFFAVTASIPSVSLAEAPAGYRNNSGFVPGDKLMYDPFTIRLLVDEEMHVYKELFSWLKFNTNHEKHKISDISLMILTSHNNPNEVFRFVNAFPTNIGQIEFNIQTQDIEYAAIDVTFRYDYFTIVDANGSAFAC